MSSKNNAEQTVPASTASSTRVVKKVVLKKKAEPTTPEPKAAKKVVAKKTTTAAPEKKVVAKKVVAKKAPKAEGGKRILGKTSGLNVKGTLAKLFHDNHTAKLTDAKLAKALQKEFPSCADKPLYQEAAFTRLRREYNKGLFTHGEVPKRQSVAYEG